jgi:hypothetical protein
VATLTPVMSWTPSQPAVAAPPVTRPAHGEWRRRRLIAAGFDAPLAAQLTRGEAVELHELLVLLDRGCAPVLAARILTPLDEPVPE